MNNLLGSIKFVQLHCERSLDNLGCCLLLFLKKLIYPICITYARISIEWLMKAYNRISARITNCVTSAGAAAAGAGAAAPAIMTGASEMFSFDFSKLFRSAPWLCCSLSGSVPY